MKKEYIKLPEDKINNTYPTRWWMCKFIRNFEWVNFAFGHPFIGKMTRKEIHFSINVLLRLDKTPSYIHINAGTEVYRACFVFSYNGSHGLRSNFFSVPPESSYNELLPKLDDPEKTARLINNCLKYL